MSQNLTKKAKANALDSLNQNMQAYATAIDSIALDKTVETSFFESDFVLVGIPPLEIVPTFESQVVNTTSKASALGFLKVLSERYNSELKMISSELRKRHKHSRVFFLDLARLVHIFRSPSTTLPLILTLIARSGPPSTPLPILTDSPPIPSPLPVTTPPLEHSARIPMSTSTGILCIPPLRFIR